MTIGTLDTKGWWAVNNKPIYVPGKGLKISHNTIAGSGSGRMEDGVMFIEWVRSDVRKVFLAYPYLTASELKYMKDLMLGKIFNLKYRDLGVTYTIQAYCSEVNYTFYSYALDGEEIYKDITMNAIQT